VYYIETLQHETFDVTTNIFDDLDNKFFTTLKSDKE